MTASVSPEVFERWRKDFEKLHRIPDFVIWNGKEYAHKDDKLSGAAMALSDALNVWIKSRKTLVIDLPRVKQGSEFELELLRHQIEVMRAIESQGYPVEVDGANSPKN